MWSLKIWNRLQTSLDVIFTCDKTAVFLKSPDDFVQSNEQKCRFVRSTSIRVMK